MLFLLIPNVAFIVPQQSDPLPHPKNRSRIPLGQGCLDFAQDAGRGADGKPVRHGKKVVVRDLRLLAVDGQLMATAMSRPGII